MEEEQQAGIEETVKEEVKEDIEAIKNALAEAKARVEANLAGWQRAQADFINYKRRAEQEKAEAGELAKASLMLNLLPFLDDMERAFNAIPSELSELGWVEGIRLIGRKLQVILEAQGLSQIKALGEPFDPRLHEAAMQGKGKEGVVVGELQKGYKFRHRVLRPTRVVVGSGEEDERKE